MLWVILWLALSTAYALVPVDSSMSSFGVAIKSGRCKQGQEQVVFEHNVSSTATHAVITQMWHAGTRGDPRMRIYVDAEVGTGIAAVDYSVSVAHGLAPEDHGVYPWQSENFGHTHNMGWYNTYRIPFEKRVLITMTCSVNSPFWFRVGGAENFPIAVGELQLPVHAKLRIEKFERSVGLGALVDLAVLNGTAGLLSQVSVFIQSKRAYQEGCVQATLDGRKFWLSSGLEDYFLGSYFHTMPNMKLPLVGFQLSNSSVCPEKENGPNSLAAYRIHSPDPVLFSKSLRFQWQATGMQKDAGPTSCNFKWPQSGEIETLGPEGNTTAGVINITSYAWVYVYGPSHSKSLSI